MSIKVNVFKMFSKITKLNDYDKVTLIYEPTVQAKQQKSKFLTYLLILVGAAIFLLGVNFAFHFLRFTHLVPPLPGKYHPNADPTGDQKCPKVEFDYLLLSIRWPPSFCNYQHCKKNVKMFDWDIHGLWPDYRNGTFPSFCCQNYKFDIKQLNSIIPELKVKWQDLTYEDSEYALWTHEWEKHGTCTAISPKLGTISNYFNSTLSLFKKYNVQQWLEEENILPTSAKPYELSSILNAIESRLNGRRIKVECDTHKTFKVNCTDYSSDRLEDCTQESPAKVYKLLDSIDLCFDKMTLEPIDCPLEKKKYRKSTCDKQVYYFRTKEDLDTLKF